MGRAWNNNAPVLRSEQWEETLGERERAVVSVPGTSLFENKIRFDKK